MSCYPSPELSSFVSMKLSTPLTTRFLALTAHMISLPAASRTKSVSPAQLPCQAAPGEAWCRATFLCHLTLLQNAPEVEAYYLSQENTGLFFFSTTC